MTCPPYCLSSPGVERCNLFLPTRDDLTGLVHQRERGLLDSVRRTVTSLAVRDIEGNQVVMISDYDRVGIRKNEVRDSLVRPFITPQNLSGPRVDRGHSVRSALNSFAVLKPRKLATGTGEKNFAGKYDLGRQSQIFCFPLGIAGRARDGPEVSAA